MRSLVRGLHFEMSTRQPSRDVKEVIVGRYLEFREMSGLEIQILESAEYS